MAKKKLHKTLLVLLLVLVPPYFLLLTDEGRRVADNTVLWAFGGESIELNLRELDGSYTRDEILKVFPDQNWQCQKRTTPFGDELCASEVSSFNDYPAKYVTVFFTVGKANALKLVYRESYHDQILGHLIEQLGQPSNVADATKATPDAANVLEWHMRKGVVVMQKHLQKDGEASFLWLAPGN